MPLKKEILRDAEDFFFYFELSALSFQLSTFTSTCIHNTAGTPDSYGFP